MTDITKEILEQTEYDFLRENPHLGDRIIMLGLAGSYSYGTNNDDSDVDIRGVALNSREDLLGFGKFEQYVDHETDTVIYSFNKLIGLLTNCNPNTIELLGMKPEHYLYLSDIGRELIDKRHLFLTKRAIHAFGGYADAQLRRLQNALARDRLSQPDREKHIYNSVRSAMYSFNDRYSDFDGGSVSIYIDDAVNPGLDKEIFVDTNLKHYPLRDYAGMWADMSNVVREYSKIGNRNKKKDDNHLNKHAMHLVRLLLTGIDILEKGEIITYRENDLDLLRSIRGGYYQNPDGTYKDEFFDIVETLEKKLHKAAEETMLPDEPDNAAIEAFVMSVNERSLDI